MFVYLYEIVRVGNEIPVHNSVKCAFAEVYPFATHKLIDVVVETNGLGDGSANSL